MPARNRGPRPDLLVLSPQLAPPAGGVERMADDVFDAFPEWNVRMIGMSSVPRDDPRIRVVKLMPGRVGGVLARARYFVAAWSELRRNPRIVQSMTWLAATPTLLPGGKRAPTVLFCMGGELVRSTGGNALRRRVLTRMTGLAAISPFTAGLVRDRCDRDPAVILPALRQVPTDVSPIAHDGVRILSVGRLVANKGHDHLIRAFAVTHGNVPTAVLTIVGTGSEEAALRALASELGVADAVTFAGGVTDAERDELYRSADIFALLSTPVGSEVEGFGIVFLEAGAFGLPVVAGRSGGSGAAVDDGVTGYITDDVDETAGALTRLATDASLRTRLGEAGRARLAQFTLERFRTELSALYDASIAAHAAGSRL